jgi:predicted SnoaL-like aldol condensation-catalyzing enzyme
MHHARGGVPSANISFPHHVMVKVSPQKDAIQSFLAMVIKGNIERAYELYVHLECRHHNVYHNGDRASLMKGMIENHEKFPKKKFTVKKILEEGDTVMTHSQLLMDEHTEISVVHIFRFKDGKVIEMWDVGQPIPKDSPNENGAF